MSGRGGEQIHSIDQSILWSSARRVDPRFAYSDSRSRSLTFDKNNSSTLSTRKENAEVQPWAARASFFLAQSPAKFGIEDEADSNVAFAPNAAEADSGGGGGTTPSVIAAMRLCSRANAPSIVWA